MYAICWLLASRPVSASSVVVGGGGAFYLNSATGVVSQSSYGGEMHQDSRHLHGCNTGVWGCGGIVLSAAFHRITKTSETVVCLCCSCLNRLLPTVVTLPLNFQCVGVWGDHVESSISQSYQNIGECFVFVLLMLQQPASNGFCASAHLTTHQSFALKGMGKNRPQSCSRLCFLLIVLVQAYLMWEMLIGRIPSGSKIG